MMTRTTFGVDLGGCMSGNSAYALVEWTGKKARVIELFKEPKHKDHHSCTKFLKETLSKYNVDAIAVDAPFSLPRSLTQADFQPPHREAAGEISNPYLFRYTDYWLYKTYNLRPMPPAGDRIGRLTARMIELLQDLDYNAPFISLQQRKTPIYEVYPKQIALALGYEKYKDKGVRILEVFDITETVDEHLIDAILASYCASMILEKKTVFPTKEAEDEGWCYPLVE
jgi:predicted nuclease with RNAse H fold